MKKIKIMKQKKLKIRNSTLVQYRQNKVHRNPTSTEPTTTTVTTNTITGVDFRSGTKGLRQY